MFFYIFRYLEIISHHATRLPSRFSVVNSGLLVLTRTPKTVSIRPLLEAISQYVSISNKSFTSKTTTTTTTTRPRCPFPNIQTYWQYLTLLWQYLIYVVFCFMNLLGIPFGITLSWIFWNRPYRAGEKTDMWQVDTSTLIQHSQLTRVADKKLNIDITNKTGKNWVPSYLKYLTVDSMQRAKKTRGDS